MKIGGRAYRNGVALYGEHYSVKAYYTDNDRLTYRIGKNALADNKLYQISRKIPVLRGIVNLILSIYFFIKEAASKPKRFWPILLLLTITVSIELYIILFPTQSVQLVNQVLFLPAEVYWSGLLALAFLLRQTLLKPIFKFHGAEHKAVNYYQNKSQGNLASYSRLARRCGTNLIVVFLLLLALVRYLGWGVNLYLQALLLLGLAYEILLFMPNRLLSVPFVVQRFTTIEPDKRQLKAAQMALDVLIRKEDSKD